MRWQRVGEAAQSRTFANRTTAEKFAERLAHEPAKGGALVLLRLDVRNVGGWRELVAS